MRNSKLSVLKWKTNSLTVANELRDPPTYIVIYLSLWQIVRVTSVIFNDTLTVITSGLGRHDMSGLAGGGIV